MQEHNKRSATTTTRSTRNQIYRRHTKHTQKHTHKTRLPDVQMDVASGSVGTYTLPYVAPVFKKKS